MKRIIMILLVMVMVLPTITYANNKKTINKKNIGKFRPYISAYNYYGGADDEYEKLYVSARFKKKLNVKGNIKYVFYKKKNKKFKKVATVSGKNGKSKEVCIKTHCERNEQIKVRAFIKKKNKKYYSKYSKIKKIMIPKRQAQYSVESLSPSQTYLNMKRIDVRFKIKSKNKFNGDTIFKGANLDEFDFEQYRKERKQIEEYFPETPHITYIYNSGFKEENGVEKWNSYFLGLKKYSYNNKNWKTIPAKGVTLKRNKTIYFEGTIYNEYDENIKDIYYAGSDKKNYLGSFILPNEEVFEYKSPFSVCLFSKFNLLTKKGYAYYDQD